jgi:hypothetical protein
MAALRRPRKRGKPKCTCTQNVCTNARTKPGRLSPAVIFGCFDRFVIDYVGQRGLFAYHDMAVITRLLEEAHKTPY